jgi:type IV fimbrial biogenesis protein FimT
MRFDQRQSPPARRQATHAGATAGFSLIEVIVVVAITAVLASIAVPNMITAKRGFDLSTAGTSAVNRLGEARMEAIKRNRPVNVVIEGASRTMTLSYTDPGPVVVTLGVEQLPSGITLDLGGNPDMTITFDALGRPLNPPQTFAINHAELDQTRTVTVETTGRVTLAQD